MKNDKIKDAEWKSRIESQQLKSNSNSKSGCRMKIEFKYKIEISGRGGDRGT
jgi:hypothetical protein